MGYPRTISSKMRLHLSYITQALQELNPGQSLLVENIPDPFQEAYRLRCLFQIDNLTDHFTISLKPSSFTITKVDKTPFSPRIILGQEKAKPIGWSGVPKEMIERATQELERKRAQEQGE